MALCGFVNVVSSKWNYHQRRRYPVSKLSNMPNQPLGAGMLGGKVVKIAVVFHIMVM